MPYKQCQFRRQDYLDNSWSFENVQLENAQNKLCEIEYLAFELAYTRYALAKLEVSVCCFLREELGNMNFENDQEAIDYMLSFFEA
jgi:hypothetical protein